jgi:hypothetical protein
VIAATIYAYERTSGPPTPGTDSSPAEPAQQQPWERSDIPAVVRPSTVPAASADLGDDEEVIGVEAGGRPRAYAIRAIRHPRFHIVNDLLGGVPVSVTYCVKTDCTQVYTGPGDAPLAIAQAGLRQGEMVIRVGDVQYEHRTGRAIGAPASAHAFPYESSPWTRTTWGEWKRRHPATDVYRGGAGREATAHGR